MFTAKQIFPGVWHTADALGVHFTLLVGNRRALLVDTGYGLEDVHAWVRSVTELPVTVLLTHGHHDHALGARWFEQVMIFPQDRDVYRTYTTPERRRRVADSACQNHVPVPEDFLTAAYPEPIPAT